ncbi:uncharacterized protein LOC105172056 [Sesamum indicum]|uniref:Uncharacterized protein LOC105172056 n=1 Tax=Sesamum indicum TaxID=4182 RepID=A0A8M8V9W5_SESIN|nr:uncharacterized protein LOC105172056 [Sesamum indicum]
MSVNYDNWERLVGAVLRREGDREIALADSRDPSIISSSSRTSSASADSRDPSIIIIISRTSSASAFSTSDLSSFTSYISQFDHTPSGIRLPMDYTDLKLDHHEWKTMLPPDKPEAVWTSASLSFSLDPGTGKNCFMLGATKLVVFLPDSWEIRSHPKSRMCRFEEVVVPRDSWGFDIRGRIHTRMLSPETFYEVYLVYELADKGTEMDNFARARITNLFRGRALDIYHPRSQEKMVRLFQPSSGRDDGWMEIQLGCFYVGYALRGEVEVQLSDINYRMNIIVEGIEFRPMKAKKTFGFFQYNEYRFPYRIKWFHAAVSESITVRGIFDFLLVEGYYPYRDINVDQGSQGVVEARFLERNGYGMEGLVIEVIFLIEMAMNYDNWERLVGAVLRREGDREIALADSRDPSISGSRTSSAFAPSTSDLSSSASYISRFDHTPNLTRLPMDYTDLTLDHHEWKTMLPPDKHEAVWRSAALSFSLDPDTGKNCFTLGVAKLVFVPEGWEMKSHPKSRMCRFKEVAVPRYSWGLDIRGRITTQMLTPETLYEAYLVFELADKNTKIEYFAQARVRNFFRGRELDIDRPGRQEKMVSFQPSSGRDDGWMEIQLGCFYVDHGLKGEVEARLLDTNYRMDIIVEGIEFRPMKAKKSTKPKGFFQTFGFRQHN